MRKVSDDLRREPVQMRRYSSNTIKKRHRQFRKWLGRNVNPIRFTVALPVGINLDDIDWWPTWLDREWERVQRVKAEIDREFLEDATRRLGTLSLIVEQDARELALIAEQERIDEYHRQEAIDNARIVAEMGKAWDALRLKQMRARADKAGREITRSIVRSEREAFKRRGLLRGTR
jgi:hypothetical protein